MTSNAVKGKSGIARDFGSRELTHALANLEAAGIPVELASIQGGNAPIDGFDLEDGTNAHYWNDWTFKEALEHTNRLDDLDSSLYSAIFFAGGRGTTWDFPESEAVKRVTRQIWEAGGVVSAVCRGPAALVNVKLGDGTYLVAGKRVAAFTTAEEEDVKSTDIVPFLLETALKAHGALHQPAANWSANIITDGRLVTGQKLASAAGVGKSIADLVVATSAPTRP